jgi:PPP family 3-phenylpropionic acid transporter
VRWAVVGFTRDPIVLLAVQSLHALTFGAYYVASVAIVDEESASSTRTTGQGIVGAWSYGVAAALALSFSGFVERHYGLSVVFRIGAIASTIAALIPLKSSVSPSRSR